NRSRITELGRRRTSSWHADQRRNTIRAASDATPDPARICALGLRSSRMWPGPVSFSFGGGAYGGQRLAVASRLARPHRSRAVESPRGPFRGGSPVSGERRPVSLLGRVDGIRDANAVRPACPGVARRA